MVKLNLSQKAVIDLSVIILLITLAALIRAPGLGKWCLTADEFYFSEPIARIIDDGLPQLKGGGYYFRGFGLTYPTALVSQFFNNWEFAVRLPSLIAGVLAVPLLYIFARLFLPVAPSLLCSSYLLFSSWHIEFSRFARFYVPFQFIFIGFLYFFITGYFQGKKRHCTIAWALAVLAPTIYDGAIFMPFVFFLLFIHQKNPVKLRSIYLLLGIAGLFAINFMIQKDIVRYIVEIFKPALDTQSGRIYLENITQAKKNGPPIVFPDLALITSIGISNLSKLCYLVLTAGALFVFKKCYDFNEGFWPNVAIFFLTVLPLVHLYGVLVFCILIITLGRVEVQKSIIKKWKYWSPFIVLSIVYWIYVMFLSGAISAEKNQSLHFLIGYPPIKKTILIPYAQYVPFWSLVITIPVMFGLLSGFIVYKTDVERVLIMIFLSMVFLIGSIDTLWHSTRYSFFLLPAVLLIGHIELYHWYKRIRGNAEQKIRKTVAIAFILFATFAFLVSEDFNFEHFTNVADAQNNFRMGRYDKLSRHWYPRVDIKSPAEYVNRTYKDGDMVVLDHVITSKYLTVPYVNYVSNADHIRFSYHSRKYGTIEKWSGEKLVSTRSGFVDLITKNNDAALWLIAAGVPDRIGTSFNVKGHLPQDIADEYNLELQKVFNSIDGRVAVWKYTQKQ